MGENPQSETGGRYDKLLTQFGKDVPAIGFAIVIDQLMLAMSRQDIDIETKPMDIMVLYDVKAQDRAVKTARKFRENQKRTMLVRKSSRISVEQYQSYGARKGFDRLLWMKENGEDCSLEIRGDGEQGIWR